MPRKKPPPRVKKPRLKPNRPTPKLSYRLTWRKEREFHPPGTSVVAGVDEAGRGCWAGPVHAAAVILPVGLTHRWLADSKKVTSANRQVVADFLRNHPGVIWAIGVATVEEIDTLNILQAALLAMKRAVESLKTVPHLCLIDGRQLPGISQECRAIIQGDALCPSIAAASLLAKTTRDQVMCAAAELYPQFGFENHKGYGTPEHQYALAYHGPSPLHRRSFRPVRLHPGTSS